MKINSEISKLFYIKFINLCVYNVQFVFLHLMNGTLKKLFYFKQIGNYHLLFYVCELYFIKYFSHYFILLLLLACLIKLKVNYNIFLY